MKSALRVLTFLVPFFLLASCVPGIPTAPRHEVENSRTYDRSFEETWDRVMHYMSEHPFKITDEDKAKGEIRAVLTPVGEGRLEAFSSCPASLMWLFGPGHAATGSIQVILVAQGSGTRVTVWAWFMRSTPTYWNEQLQVYPSVRGSHPARGGFYCESAGVLEGEVLNSL